MKRIIQALIFVIALTIPLFAISVINPPASTGTGSGDVVGPASNNNTYVPQWDGADSKTLANGFPISAQGKTFVNLSSTANMRSNLGLANHQLLTVSATGINVSGTVTANTLVGSLGATNLTGTVASARLSGAYTGITGLGTLTGASIGTSSTHGTLSVSGNVRVTGNIYVSGNKISTTGRFAFGIDGGTSVPSTGNLNSVFVVPVTCTATDWYIGSDVTGNAVLDIKRNGTSIIGGSGNKPTLISASKASAAIASWTSTTLTAGDRLTFVLDSIATAKCVTVIVKTKEQ